MAFGARGYGQTIACIKKQGVLYNTYTTAKSMLTSATSVVGVSDQLPITSPPDYNDGHKWKLIFQAGLSNIVTTPGTFNIQVVLGGVAVYDSGAIILTTTAHTLTPMWGEIDLTLDTSGNGTLAKFRQHPRRPGRHLAYLRARFARAWAVDLGHGNLSSARLRG